MGAFITAIMPTTYHRRHLLPLSIGCFAKQRLPGLMKPSDVKLVVVSEDTAALDVAESCRPLLGDRPLTLHQCKPGMMVGAKRNLACEKGTGEWLLFWDDDDWCHPDRLARTVGLMQQGIQLIGSRSMLIHEILDPRRRTFLFEYPRAKFEEEKYFVGGLLGFHRSLWEKYPFNPNQYSGEDGWWVLERLREGTQFAEISDPLLYVAMRHKTNTGNTQTPQGDPWWIPWGGSGTVNVDWAMNGELPVWEAAFAAMQAEIAEAEFTRMASSQPSPQGTL